jgi:hypothetical protein
LRGDVVDTLGIAGDTANTETLIVDLVPVALSTDSVDGVVPSDAAALTVRKDLIDSTANHAEPTLIAISRGTSTGT